MDSHKEESGPASLLVRVGRAMAPVCCQILKQTQSTDGCLPSVHPPGVRTHGTGDSFVPSLLLAKESID